MGVIRGDTRSLDYSSYGVRVIEVWGPTLEELERDPSLSDTATLSN